MNSKLSNLIKLLKNKFTWIISFVILSILSIVIRDQWTQIKNNVWPQKNPYVAVVMSKNIPDFPVPIEFLEGFKKAAGDKEYIETVYNRVISIKYIDDFGSPEIAREITKRLCNDKYCVLIVGNSNSTLTEQTLNILLKQENPPSFIMPIATSNELIDRAKIANYKAILRLPPNNKKQAEKIVQAIRSVVKKKAFKVAIYSDSDNPFYSINLTRDVANIAREAGGLIIAEETIGPFNSFYSSLSMYRTRTKPDIIVYNGLVHNGLLLLDQLQNTNLNFPIILSDGCMSNKLVKYLKGERKIFITSTVKVKENIKNLTYSSYGEDTYKIIEKIINDITIINRKNLYQYISKNKENIQLDYGTAGKYKFNGYGENVLAKYSIYKVLC